MPAVFNRLVNDNNLEFKQAYGLVYVYRKDSAGEVFVNNADLLRWYQNEKTWTVAVDQDDVVKKNPRYEGWSLIERLPILIPRIKEALGEPVGKNQAEFTGIVDSYKPYTGESAWEVNKRYLDDLEESRRQKKQAEERSYQLEREAARERRERRNSRRMNCTTIRSGSTSHTNCM